MGKRMSLWGIGGKLAAGTLFYAALAIGLHIATYPMFKITLIPGVLLVYAGVLLLLVGIPLWVLSAATIVEDYEQDKLITRSVYGRFRHPLYAAFVIFIIPALSLFVQSWLALTIPIAMYTIFRSLIGEEDAYLERRFGKTYRHYRDHVNAVFPTFHRYQPPADGTKKKR